MQDDALTQVAAVDARAWPARIRVLHWITAILVLAAIAAVVSHDWFDGDGLRRGLMSFHRQAGITVLALTLLRLPMRAAARAPAYRTSRTVRAVAKCTHALAYLLLLALPLLGWAFTNVRGKPVAVLGLRLPHIVARNRDLAEQLQSLHGTLGWTLLVLIGLHVLAALWHHYIARDDVLRSMARGRRAA